jgi:hypothetical protein
MFTKLGWMILAKKNGMMDKAMVYQNGSIILSVKK